MREFKWIIRENIPKWYEISWQNNPPAIVFRMHEDFIANLNVDLEHTPFVESYKKDFKFQQFSGDFNQDIGFEGAFKHIGEKDGFIEFLIEIPRIKKETNEICSRCNGSGRDEDLDMDCLSCSGTGKAYIMDWQKANAISASFTLFTELLTYCHKIDTSAISSQLLTIATATGQSVHGGSMSGEVSIPLTEWLNSLGNHAEIPEVVQVMEIAYNQMFGLQDFDEYSFHFRIEKNGKFILDCPGDACGLHPSDWNTKEGEGSKFSCHNVDNSAQQLTLIAGLCALLDAYRKANSIDH